MATTIVRSRLKTNRANGNVITQHYQNPVYAATLAITTTAEDTLVQPSQLTGALSLIADTTNALIGDSLTILFAADGSSRVVTFGSGFATTGTLTVSAGKYGVAAFIYDGTNWVQLSATATA